MFSIQNLSKDEIPLWVYGLLAELLADSKAFDFVEIGNRSINYNVNSGCEFWSDIYQCLKSVSVSVIETVVKDYINIKNKGLEDDNKLRFEDLSSKSVLMTFLFIPQTFYQKVDQTDKTIEKTLKLTATQKKEFIKEFDSYCNNYIFNVNKINSSAHLSLVLKFCNTKEFKTNIRLNFKANHRNIYDYNENIFNDIEPDLLNYFRFENKSLTNLVERDKTHTLNIIGHMVESFDRYFLPGKNGTGWISRNMTRLSKNNSRVKVSDGELDLGNLDQLELNSFIELDEFRDIMMSIKEASELCFKVKSSVRYNLIDWRKDKIISRDVDLLNKSKNIRYFRNKRTINIYKHVYSYKIDLNPDALNKFNRAINFLDEIDSLDSINENNMYLLAEKFFFDELKLYAESTNQIATKDFKLIPNPDRSGVVASTLSGGIVIPFRNTQTDKQRYDMGISISRRIIKGYLALCRLEQHLSKMGLAVINMPTLNFSYNYTTLKDFIIYNTVDKNSSKHLVDYFSSYKLLSDKEFKSDFVFKDLIDKGFDDFNSRLDKSEVKNIVDNTLQNVDLNCIYSGLYVSEMIKNKIQYKVELGEFIESISSIINVSDIGNVEDYKDILKLILKQIYNISLSSYEFRDNGKPNALKLSMYFLSKLLKKLLATIGLFKGTTLLIDDTFDYARLSKITKQTLDKLSIQYKTEINFDFVLKSFYTELVNSKDTVDRNSGVSKVIVNGKVTDVNNVDTFKDYLTGSINKTLPADKDSNVTEINKYNFLFQFTDLVVTQYLKQLISKGVKVDLAGMNSLDKIIYALNYVDVVDKYVYFTNEFSKDIFKVTNSFDDIVLAELNKHVQDFDLIKSIHSLKGQVKIKNNNMYGTELSELIKDVFSNLNINLITKQFLTEDVDENREYLNKIRRENFLILSELETMNTVSLFETIELIRNKLSRKFKKELFISNTGYLNIEGSIMRKLINRVDSLKGESILNGKSLTIAKLISNNSRYTEDKDGFIYLDGKLICTQNTKENVLKILNRVGILTYSLSTGLITSQYDLSEEDTLWILPRS